MPRAKAEPKHIITSVSFPPDILDRLRAQARQRDRSVSYLVCRAARLWYATQANEAEEKESR
jgi:hypothetical protein